MSILFLHIPKAAGTYVDSCVKQAKIDSAHAISTSESLRTAIQSRKQYIAGHFTFNNLAAASIPFERYKLVTVIRNPIDRFISDLNYHIEIMKRGQAFFKKHSLNWQRLILRTYQAIDESRDRNTADFSHLTSIMLKEYLASRLLSLNEIQKLEKLSVHAAINEIDIILKRYSFIGIVEKNGANLLLEYVSRELKFDTDNIKPNSNASSNYVPYEKAVPSVASALARSSISNLLYLKLTKNLPDDCSTVEWFDINTLASVIYVSESRYKNKESLDLPSIQLSSFT